MLKTSNIKMNQIGSVKIGDQGNRVLWNFLTINFNIQFIEDFFNVKGCLRIHSKIRKTMKKYGIKNQVKGKSSLGKYADNYGLKVSQSQSRSILAVEAVSNIGEIRINHFYLMFTIVLLVRTIRVSQAKHPVQRTKPHEKYI